MKKHILILAAAITPLAFFSCSKEGSLPEQGSNPEQALIQKHPPMPIVDLQKDLDGKFEFNGNLLDKTGQLKAVVFNSRYKPLYTADRKGAPNGAIEFNGAYGLVIDNVPNDTSASIAAWVKYEGYPTNGNVAMVEGAGSLSFMQFENTYQAATWNSVFGSGQYVISGPIDRDWHHLVATRDASILKFYIDGTLVGSSPTPAGGGPLDAFSQFVIGFGWNAGYQYWKGSMDDLCFYGRTLSWADVQALYNL
jgi:hypothetical protein